MCYTVFRSVGGCCFVYETQMGAEPRKWDKHEAILLWYTCCTQLLCSLCSGQKIVAITSAYKNAATGLLHFEEKEGTLWKTLTLYVKLWLKMPFIFNSLKVPKLLNANWDKLLYLSDPQFVPVVIRSGSERNYNHLLFWWYFFLVPFATRGW